MTKAFETIIRGILLGGAFGVKIGTLVGYFAQDTWVWMTYLLFVGMIIGIVVASALLLNQAFSSNPNINVIKKSNLSMGRLQKPYWMSR